ncbi:beta-1,3-galactosyltransferase brn isoform X2 [Sitophilus oryzae]|uniref:Hexosyltransferase n=1 Tax=Sitophilus oryzae TaxID=7048 RepID=A0A6J2YYH7_SITOR|nr:beta-1,3-galactosyltransferase brn isoform X2 [Sitophilus oryzae]
MCLRRRSKLKKLYIVFGFVLCFSVLSIFGVFHHAFEIDFYSGFHYPYDGDIEPLINQLRHNETPSVPPINEYNFIYYKNCDRKCKDITDLRLIYIVKSAASNFQQRLAIRSSWGFERRFSDVGIRTVFLIGNIKDVHLQKFITEESHKFNDIVQANFTDVYFNNTYKLMSGLYWAFKYCEKAKFYMFVDDDYYVSTKNVLRFIKFPTKYPEYLKEPFANIQAHLGQRKALDLLDFELDNDVRLYAGYGFHSVPFRHYFSKWYVPLSEYPYHKWPPYISGGAIILSNSALRDIL